MGEPERVHPFLDHPLPLAIAHRGGAGEAPENTLPAFASAVALGYHHVETDVHLTHDGELVAFHDALLDRVTDGTGAIAALDLADVQSADAGHTFSPDGGQTFPFRGRGVQIPRLEDLLTAWPELYVNIDPKSDLCVEPLAALLDRLDAWHRVCVGSFSDARLRRMRALGLHRACTSMGPRAVVIARATAAAGLMPRQGADCVQVPIRRGRVVIVTQRFVAAAHRAGLQVHVWTIDDEPTMERLLELGVDGLMSDRLRLLRAVLMRRRQWSAHPPPPVGIRLRRMGNTEPVEVVRGWIDAYNSGRDDQLVALAHPDVVLRPMRFHGQREYHGIEGVHRLLADIATNRPKFICDDLEALDAHRVLAEGSLQDVGPAINLYHVRDGKIASVQGYLSDRPVLEQLGII